jgi:hypothetical protein
LIKVLGHQAGFVLINCTISLGFLLTKHLTT